MAFLDDLRQVMGIRSLDERIGDATRMLEGRVSLENNPDLRTFGSLLEYASPSSGVMPMMGLFFTPKILKQVGILSENIPQMGKLSPQLARSVRKVQSTLGKMFDRTEQLSQATAITSKDKKRFLDDLKEVEKRFQDITGKPVTIDPSTIIYPNTGLPSKDSLTGLLSFSQELLNVGDLVRNNDVIRKINLSTTPLQGASGTWEWRDKILSFDPHRVGGLILKGNSPTSTPLQKANSMSSQDVFAHELGHAAENKMLGSSFLPTRISDDPLPYVFSDDWVRMVQDMGRTTYPEIQYPSPFKNTDAAFLGSVLERDAPRAFNEVLGGRTLTPSEHSQNLFRALDEHGTGAVPQLGYGLSTPVEFVSTLTEGLTHNPQLMQRNQPQASSRLIEMLEGLFGWVPGTTRRGSR